MRRAEIHQRVLSNKKSIEIDLIKILEMKLMKKNSNLIFDQLNLNRKHTFFAGKSFFLIS